MDVPTLIVLGAAGGLLRGAVDLYTRFVSWQAVRLACLQAGNQAPRFREYFDPSTDIVAPAVHTVMGAGAAVLFGTTGQISGAYAALVVGMSAPMLLTQLTRVQTVNEVITGDRPAPETAQTAAENGTTATGALAGTGPAGAVGPPLFPVEPGLAPSAGPAHPSAPNPSSRPTARSSARPPAAVTRAQDPGPEEPPADEAQLHEPARPTSTPLAADAPDGTGSGIDGRSAPRWRHGPVMGEEGL
ncbi:hypothetical protein A4E84_00095 [Streptomyces qaidamensis]|uniref:Uncharacterized protein n=1 Tax=Streptomyces qaidamensis TaxID=1783515 RepID=A0A143BSJ2_9ACTN|nr:hypothetical protein A4E84_00095 [Streptomyces qaidamensis]